MGVAGVGSAEGVSPSRSSLTRASEEEEGRSAQARLGRKRERMDSQVTLGITSSSDPWASLLNFSLTSSYPPRARGAVAKASLKHLTAPTSLPVALATMGGRGGGAKFLCSAGE